MTARHLRSKGRKQTSTEVHIYRKCLTSSIHVPLTATTLARGGFSCLSNSKTRIIGVARHSHEHPRKVKVQFRSKIDSQKSRRALPGGGDGPGFRARFSHLAPSPSLYNTKLHVEGRYGYSPGERLSNSRVVTLLPLIFTYVQNQKHRLPFDTVYRVLSWSQRPKTTAACPLSHPRFSSKSLLAATSRAPLSPPRAARLPLPPCLRSTSRRTMP